MTTSVLGTLSSSLETAVAGLRATQAQIQVISGNIANVQTPGYSRETLPQETVINGASSSVDVGAVQRVVDQVLNTNLVNQTTTASASTTLDTYYKQIEDLFGQVGSGATINDALDKFVSAMQTVATSPQSPVAQGAAVAAGQTLAQRLNQISAGTQTIRQSSDTQLAADVGTLNTALQSIASLNDQITELQAQGQSTAEQQDQRDQQLAQVAQQIGVNTYTTSSGAMVVTTTNGQILVDEAGAATLGYVPAGNVNASTVLSKLTLNGADITSSVTTGALGTLLQLRDTTLPGLTAQVNQFTNNLFGAAQVSQSSLTMVASAGPIATGDTYTANIDGSTYTTLGLPANPAMSDVANALNAQFKARATIPVAGGAPQSGDSFKATIDGTNYVTGALAGAGPFGTSDIVNALNNTLTAISVPVTVNTPATGDRFDVTVNGTVYTTPVGSALSGGGPYTINNIAAAVQAALPANFTATVNGGNIVIADKSGVLSSARIALHTGGTGSETFGAGTQASTFSAQVDGSGNIVFVDAAGNPMTASLALAGGTGTETFAAAKYSTLSASTANGNIVLTDSSGSPITATMTTNPVLTAGTPNDSGSPTTINFTQTSGSFNVGQTYDVVVDGTDYGSTAALATGSATLTGLAAAIQNVFTAKGVGFTAGVVGGQLQIADPAAKPITASVTLTAGPGSETFAAGTAASPLATTNSALNATNDANHFFANVNIAAGVDNAATIEVNPSLIANTGLLDQGASGPDPSITQNLFGNLGGNYTFAAAGSFTNSTTTTLADYSAQIVGGVANGAASADSNSTFQSALQTQLASQAGAVSGVNIDEELSNLVGFQNAYGASARVMTTIQTLYNTLMTMFA